MSRPNILVRADTIDLQDTDAPHASDHTKHLNGSSIAPHQASQYQQVVEERHSEEVALADAWNMSGTNTNQAAGLHENQDEKMNGQADGEGTDGEDGEQDADDDLMDRISSSPSIDEGEHILSQTVPYHSEANFNILLQRPASASILARRRQESRLETGHGSAKQYRRASVDALETLSSRNKILSRLATAGLANPLLSKTHKDPAGRYSLDSESELDLTNTTLTSVYNSWNSDYDNRYPITRNAFQSLAAVDHGLPLGHISTPAPVSSHLLRSTSSLNLNLGLEDFLLPDYDPLISSDDSPTSEKDDDDYDEDISDISLDSPDRIAPSQVSNDLFFFDPSLRNNGWADEYLLELEDIDFEFVYALHTFVATVEGQANATKGDTMVLLDDSNSYWWLVRVVKDSSIGYLPAEHIETPTERLARLNKHRNIDLSQAMLGDAPEKSRNPLKIMRRRTGKTVQFAAPTYVEASDYEYSDDEEQPPNEVFTNPQQVDDPAANGQPIEVEERNAPEEANVHATRRYSGDQASIASRNSVDSTHKASFDGGVGDDPQLSPKLVDRSEAAPLKSRKGTPRNTDSFLKDDSIETRKITLTPGILRDDSGNTVNPNGSSKSSSMDSQRNTSMESLTKTVSPADSASTASSKKDSKDKKKEKNKGGMLSGLFKSKKKDKKGGRDDDSEERASLEMARGASPQQGRSDSPNDRASTPSATGIDSQASARSINRPAQAANTPQQQPAPTTQNIPLAELEGSEAAYEMEGGVPDLAIQVPGSSRVSGDKDSVVSPVTSLLKSAPKAKRSKQRVELDDFDSPAEQTQDPFDDSAEHEEESGVNNTTSPTGTIMGGGDFVHIPTTFYDNGEEDPDSPRKTRDATRSVDSQAEATDEESQIFSDARENTTSPTGIITEHAAIQPPPSRPAPSQPPARENSTSSQSLSGAEAETPKSGSPITHDGKQNWDDSALRAWLDAEEVKDMLTIVHASARTNGHVEPVSDDHPLMQGLYSEERGAVDRMMSELDGLLMGWAGRKGIALS